MTGTDTFEMYRPMMFAIAYRMLGSAMEAEDIVQEAYLRYQATPPDSIRSLRSFLSTIVTRLCLNQLKTARVQRETYIGPWLPEPILSSDSRLNPTGQAIERESISMAFLVLLERLTPAERAVFLLHEVFDYEYAEIATMLDKEEAACRQLYSRAKKHIAEHRPRFKSSPEEHRRMLDSFMQAVGAGNLEGLTHLLAENVTIWSDGGGKVKASPRPIYGRHMAARFLLGIARFAPQGYRGEVAEVNSQPAIIIYTPEDAVMSVFMFEINQGQIQEIRAVVNPDKLSHVSAGGRGA
ncbi:MAG: RNA polymerase sigma-70 factor [Anaerolineae bacterium]|nr:RNA polymerase sigma-70 factor [Anaerolineae bacterium]